MFEVEILKNELESNRLRYEQFCRELKKQIESLLNESDIKLATPIEWRVKEWGSFYDKCISNNKQPISIFDMNDIAGLRIICLLADDVKKAENILVNNFNIRKHENTHERLLENQFGYGSIHFEITLKADWIKVPTFKNYKNIIAEIQLRTISQHIWASVSHLLQYKKEQDVPPQLKRSINRTAALLEIIDNEFERLFIERKKLVQKNIIHEETILNIESLKTILNESLPILNKRVDEPYSILLDELFRFNINTIEIYIKEYNKSVFIDGTSHSGTYYSLQVFSINKATEVIEVLV